MRLSEDQLLRYREDGYLFLPQALSAAEIRYLQQRTVTACAEDTPRRVLEKDGVTVRSVYGSHQVDTSFAALVRDARLLPPAEQLLDSAVYVHQFKINSKLAFNGDVWAWHQDYIFWQKEDGIPAPQMVTAAIYLDEVNEFNGPLVLIPGSHRRGVIDVAPLQAQPAHYEHSPDWISNLTADIKYSVPREVVAELAAGRALVAPKGPPGSVLFFHPNIVHGSASNISPFDRIVVLVTYNAVNNTPRHHGAARPDFLCSQNFRAVTALPESTDWTAPSAAEMV